MPCLTAKAIVDAAIDMDIAATEVGPDLVIIEFSRFEASPGRGFDCIREDGERRYAETIEDIKELLTNFV